MIGMALLKVEQETIILFNEAETTASVYTHNAALQRVLLELCQTHPAQVRQPRKNWGKPMTLTPQNTAS